MERVDEIDAQILTLLQASGRMKRNAIAEEVGLSVPSVSERMRKLQERGVLTGYCALVDAKRLHYDITAFIRVVTDGSVNYPAFREQACASAEVLELHSIPGEGWHILKVRTKHTASLQRRRSRIQSWPGVISTSTSIVLSTYKETRAVAVEPTAIYRYEEEEAS